jgi:hypothetical protein
MKRRLVIFCTGGMGDIIMASPMIRQLTKTYSVTLVAKRWHHPAIMLRDVSTIYYEEIKGQNVISKNPQGKTDLNISESFFEATVRGDLWIVPLLDGDVIAGGQIKKSSFPVSIVDGKNMCRSDLLLLKYTDWDGGRYEFECSTTEDTEGYRITPSIALCSSAEKLRTLPVGAVQKILSRYSHINAAVIGAEKDYPRLPIQEICASRDINLDYRCDSRKDYASIQWKFKAVADSDLVIATDCGWAWIAMALKIPVVWLESRVSYERLIPKHYWDAVKLYKSYKISCDRMCQAGREEMLARIYGDSANRPRENWQFFNGGPKEFSLRLPDAQSHFDLACRQKENVPCLDYSEADVSQILSLAEELAPALKGCRIR